MALANRSPREFMSAAIKTLAGGVQLALSPAKRKARSQDRSFDGRWGTDTSAMVSIEDMAFPASLAKEAVHYQPSMPDTVEKVLQYISIPPSEFTFLDIGCGKGRMVLCAAMVPFRRAMGVEYSEDLIGIARANSRALIRRGGSDIECEFWSGDASEFLPPPDNLLCYLYNPFGAVVLAGFIEKLEMSARASGKEVFIAYTDPQHAQVIAERGCWTCLHTMPGMSIYQFETDLAEE